MYWNSCTLHDHCIVLFIIHWLYRAVTFYCSTILPILGIFFYILCETVFSVPRPLWKINMVSDIMVGQSSDLSKTSLLTDLAWKLSNSSKIQHCSRSQGLPLNAPSKEIVDQACLIDYAGCDKILNVQSVRPYGAFFVLICRS